MQDSPQQLSFSMHSANDVCRLGSFRFLFKSHLDIIIKLAIYSGKLNRKRKKFFFMNSSVLLEPNIAQQLPNNILKNYFRVI